MAETGALLSGEMSGHISSRTGISATTMRCMPRCACSRLVANEDDTLADIRAIPAAADEHARTALPMFGGTKV